jgi:hypothetical protein
MMTDTEKLEAVQFVANVAISKATKARGHAELVISLAPVFEALGNDAPAIVPKAIKEVRRRIEEVLGADQQQAGRDALSVLELSLPGGAQGACH